VRRSSSTRNQFERGKGEKKKKCGDSRTVYVAAWVSASCSIKRTYGGWAHRTHGWKKHMHSGCVNNIDYIRLNGFLRRNHQYSYLLADCTARAIRNEGEMREEKRADFSRYFVIAWLRSRERESPCFRFNLLESLLIRKC